MLKCGVRRADLGKGLMLTAWRQPEGKGTRSSTAGNAPGRGAVYLGSEAPLLSGAQGAGPPSWTLSPHASPCLHGHWEGLPPEQVHQSVAASCQPLPLQALEGDRSASCRPLPHLRCYLPISPGGAGKWGLRHTSSWALWPLLLQQSLWLTDL